MMASTLFSIPGSPLRREPARSALQHLRRHPAHRRHPQGRWTDHPHGEACPLRVGAHGRAEAHGARLPGGDSGKFLRDLSIEPRCINVAHLFVLAVHT